MQSTIAPAVVPATSPHAAPISLIVQSTSAFDTLNNLAAHVAPSIAPPTANTNSLTPRVAVPIVMPLVIIPLNLPAILGNLPFKAFMIFLGLNLLKAFLIPPPDLPDFSLSFEIKLLKNPSTYPAIFLNKPPSPLFFLALSLNLLAASFPYCFNLSRPSFTTFFPFSLVFSINS